MYVGMHVCYTHERTLQRICTLSMHACVQIAWSTFISIYILVQGA
jgi:hypothetical protein